MPAPSKLTCYRLVTNAEHNVFNPIFVALSFIYIAINVCKGEDFNLIHVSFIYVIGSDKRDHFALAIDFLFIVPG